MAAMLAAANKKASTAKKGAKGAKGKGKGKKGAAPAKSTPAASNPAPAAKPAPEKKPEPEVVDKATQNKMDREQMLAYFEKILRMKSEYVSTALDICRRVN